MEKIVVEVGSTCTKVDLYDGNEIKHIKTGPIEFKKNYKENNKLKKEDVEHLIRLVNEIEKKEDIFVCGTSIFRDLSLEDKEAFLNEFYDKTKVKFNIISQEKENIYTVNGATKYVDEALVFVGGGGSTEISYFKNNKIECMSNNKFGVMDVLNIYVYDMCMKYDKEVSVIGYSTLTGISQSIIYEWANGENRKLSSKGMDIYKKLNEFREESLSNKLVTGNKNPVGVIAVLNRQYGWASPYTSDSNRQKKALTAAELPKLDAPNCVKLIDNSDTTTPDNT